MSELQQWVQRVADAALCAHIDTENLADWLVPVLEGELDSLELPAAVAAARCRAASIVDDLDALGGLIRRGPARETNRD